MKLGPERTVGPLPRKVRCAEAGRETPRRASLGQQEAATSVPASPATSTLQASGAVKVTVLSGSSRISQQDQLAASPATVAGSPSHDPTGSSAPAAPTDQP